MGAASAEIGCSNEIEKKLKFVFYFIFKIFVFFLILVIKDDYYEPFELWVWIHGMDPSGYELFKNWKGDR